MDSGVRLRGFCFGKFGDKRRWKLWEGNWPIAKKAWEKMAEGSRVLLARVWMLVREGRGSGKNER